MEIIELVNITIRSLLISSTATFLSMLWSIPLSLILIHRPSNIRKALISLFNALIGFPTVLVGLLLYLLLSRSGVFGFLNILYTPFAIIIGQAILITPIAVSLSTDVLEESKKSIWELAITMGASVTQAWVTMIKETFHKLIAVGIISFGRAIGELGVALMLGGNIKGFTRVFTTAIALEIQKGEFELAISLGIILLLITISIVFIVRMLGWRK